jgi:hypothetical protein
VRRTATGRAVGLATAVLLGLASLTACGGADGTQASASDSASERAQEHGSDQGSEQDSEQAMETAADQSVCKADADPVSTPYAEGFPDAWTFPAQTTAYNVEDREGTGVIVTAISSLPFKQILDYLNHDAVDAGFKITEGETEEHDAEANWASGDQEGRWAIRESPSCPGETVIQVFAAPAA